MRTKPLIEALPKPETVRHRLADALREVELLRRLLRLTEHADQYRRMSQHYQQVTRPDGPLCSGL
jgi:hypothetical protein